MIVCDRVSVLAQDDTVLLHDVDVTIAARRTAIVGANGSGKTTLARLFNGLTRPTTGSVSVDGLDVATDRRAVQRHVGFVFATADHQLVAPTPIEDVALGLRARGIATADARERALDQLRAVGMAHKADQAIHTLSGGEKHLVALAAVLVLQPAWLVIDEPTTTLDLANRARVIEALGDLTQRLVVVSHDLDLVRTFDHALLVREGAVVADGGADEVTQEYLATWERR